MLKWIACPFRRSSLHLRRSIIFPLILFTITTGLLYTWIERTTSNSTDLQSSTIKSIESFMLNCQLTNETVRSIELAPSDQCKRELKEISCRIYSQSEFFPKSLPRLCPIQKGNFGDILGCFSLNNTDETTNQSEIFSQSTLCIDYCLKQSVAFAQFDENTGFCHCLSNFDQQSHQILSKPLCSKVISSSNRIQGQYRMIYRTGYVDFGNHLEKNRQKLNQTQFSLIFFLTVGGRRNLRQIKRLVRSIYSHQHFYLIHVDSRENYLYEELTKLSESISNIHLMKKRFPTTWGSSTLLTAHLQAFKDIFEELKWNFSFILNLSESDFPLKPVAVLTNFLSMYPSYNFLRSHNREPFKFLKSQGMFHTFFQCNNYMYRIGPKTLIQKLVYDGGSDWYVLNRDFVHYVTYGNDQMINGLRHVFKYSLLPCESFFHTALSNSIYCDSYIRSNLRFVHWNRDRGCKCQHKNVVDWCGCSPLVYRSSDLNILNDTIGKPLFFARKFDPTIDESILDWLDERITRREVTTDGFYLQNIYHSHDDENELNSFWKLLDAFIRTNLIDYEDYRRDCFRDHRFQLEQIHSLYRTSLFQGYVLNYRFDDGEQLELFIRLKLIEAQRTDAIKRFEIGLNIDQKEFVFLDRSRTFIEPKMIKVLIEWRTIIETKASLVIYSPNGTFIQRIALNQSTELVLIDIFFPTISSPSFIGIWRISIVQGVFETILASINFLLLISNENQWLNIQYLTIFSNFWSIEEICSTMSNRFSCSQNSTLNLTSCLSRPWSSFYPDPKSDW